MSYIGTPPTQQAFTPAVDFFNGNGSTTAFTLSRPVASVAQVQAVISNVPQKPGDAYTVSGNTITFTSAPPSGTQNIYVYYTSPITQVIAPGQNTVFPIALSTGGPNWDTSGNLLVGMSSYGVTNAGASLSPTGSSSFYVAGGTAVTIGRGVSDGTAVQFNRSGTNVGTIGVATTGINMTGVNGVTFTATQTASSDANTLDDYEEGTWTPTATPSGGSITAYTSGGSYTKVGRMVFVEGFVSITTAGTASGYLNVANLPFTSLTVAARPSVFTVRENAITGVFYGGWGNSNATTFSISTLNFGAISWTNGYSYAFAFSYQAAS